MFDPLLIGHCIVCPSIYSFCLPLWYLQTFIRLVVKGQNSTTLFICPSMPTYRSCLRCQCVSLAVHMFLHNSGKWSFKSKTVYQLNFTFTFLRI